MKIFMICPPEFQDRILLKASDFFRFNNYTAYFEGEPPPPPIKETEKPIPPVVNDRTEYNQGKVQFLLETLASTNSSSIQGEFLLELGRTYHQLADLDHALDSLEKARVIYESSINYKMYGHVLAEMGVIYFKLKQLTTALPFFVQASLFTNEPNT